MMWGWGGYGPGGWNMGWGILSMLLGWLVPLLILGGIFYLVIPRYRETVGANRRPLDVLKERYAKGEITKEQYLEMKNDLKE